MSEELRRCMQQRQRHAVVHKVITWIGTVVAIWAVIVVMNHLMVGS